MNTLYIDTDLHAGYQQLVQRRLDDHENLPELEEEYIQEIVRRVYLSLQDILSENGRHSPPELKLYSANHPDNAEAMYVDRAGIHVGLGLLLSLDAAVLLYTDFLLRNYIYQTAPIMGDVPPLSQTVTPKAFPIEALTMHAAMLIPDAVARDGYQKRPFQSMMEFVATARHMTESPADSPIAMSRWLAKPPLDLRLYLRDVNIEELMDSYLGEAGAHYLHLHLQLLLDAFYFMLAHELAHYLLQHHLHMPQDFGQAKDEEAQADRTSLDILQSVPGFQLRSLLTLFSFCHLQEPDVPVTLLSHPFSRDRILILAHTVLETRVDEALRADINAGMSLLTTPLEHLPIMYQWEDGFEEEINVLVYHYSDVDYNAHLLFYLERPPHEVEFHDGGRENLYLLSLLSLEVDVALRDRIRPEEVHYRGQVKLRPGFSDKDVLFVYGQEAVLCRLHMRIPAPPEWWLTHPQAELAVEQIGYAEEPIPIPADEVAPQIQFHLEPVNIDLGQFLDNLPLPSEAPSAWFDVRLAARRFYEWNQKERSLQFYHRLYQNAAEFLLYPDWIDMVFALVQLDQPDDAHAVARRALANDYPMRPGFHLIIGSILADQNEMTAAFEHAFLELMGIGQFGEYFEQARDLYVSLLLGQDDPFMARLRNFQSHYDEAAALVDEKPAAARQQFQLAYDALQEAAQLASADLLSLREFTAETLLEMCILDNQGYQPAQAAFEAIVNMAPGFVPARVQLARIALLEGDPSRAFDIWQEAHAIMPFNHFVFEFREAVEPANPHFQLDSRPISDALWPPPLENQGGEGELPEHA